MGRDRTGISGTVHQLPDKGSDKNPVSPAYGPDIALLWASNMIKPLTLNCNEVRQPK